MHTGLGPRTVRVAGFCVLCCLVALAWKVSAARRVGWLADALASRASEAEGAQMAFYCEKLAQLGSAGNRRLVELAAESRPELAGAARKAIHRVISDGLARTIAARSPTMAEGQQQEFEALAEALAAQAGRLPWPGRKWLIDAVHQLMVPIEAYDAERAQRILASCDEALRLAYESQPNVEAPYLRDHAAPPRMYSNASPIVPRNASAPDAGKQRDAAVGPRPLDATVVDAEPETNRNLGALGRLNRQLPNSHWQRRSRGAIAPSLPHLEEKLDVGAANEPPTAPESPLAKPLVSEKNASPGDRPAPAIEGPVDGTVTLRVVDVPGPDGQRRLMRTYRAMSKSALASALTTAGPYEAQAIQRVLAEKGFHLERPTSTTDRSAPSGPPRSASDVFKNNAPTEDSVSIPTREMLRRLVEDEDPRIRLEALTALATSQDPQLEAIVRRRALHDTDPVVADAAKQILDSVAR